MFTPHREIGIEIKERIKEVDIYIFFGKKKVGLWWGK
jgi:hypothetical protein